MSVSKDAITFTARYRDPETQTYHTAEVYTLDKPISKAGTGLHD